MPKKGIIKRFISKRGKDISKEGRVEEVRSVLKRGKRD